eukprot:165786-Prymnesium_polylepis.1
MVYDAPGGGVGRYARPAQFSRQPKHFGQFSGQQIRNANSRGKEKFWAALGANNTIRAVLGAKFFLWAVLGANKTTRSVLGARPSSSRGSPRFFGSSRGKKLGAHVLR